MFGLSYRQYFNYITAANSKKRLIDWLIDWKYSVLSPISKNKAVDDITDWNREEVFDFLYWLPFVWCYSNKQFFGFLSYHSLHRFLCQFSIDWIANFRVFSQIFPLENKIHGSETNELKLKFSKTLNLICLLSKIIFLPLLYFLMCNASHRL